MLSSVSLSEGQKATTAHTRQSAVDSRYSGSHDGTGGVYRRRIEEISRHAPLPSSSSLRTGRAITQNHELELHDS